MALVFKVKFQDTLRRWVATEALDANSFPVTFKGLESKIKELFHLSSSALLAITYVDKDNDVVTLADDQDLIDACVVQHLNPLRLDVIVIDGSSTQHTHAPPRGSGPLPISVGNLNIEAFLSALPQATGDAVKGFLDTYTPFIDPKLPAVACLGKVESAFKEFVNGWGGNHHHGRPKFGEKPPHHANRHSWPPAPASNPHRGDTTLHWGVECDGCGMSPIEGSRYKSSEEIDYDLCENCFETIGNDRDYVKLDRPIHHSPPHGNYRPPYLRRGPKPPIVPLGHRASFSRGPYGWNPSHPFTGHQSSGSLPFGEHKKLDARFVKDVTIFDGTELAPGTKFSKIWRISNIGTLPWPTSTRLVHIGGDVLGTDNPVVLELPESGLPCGEEVEVSVDLVAPQKAGRYVSHWRLSAPSGQKFGHRVWVVIHVVPQGEHSPQLQASLPIGEKNVEAREDLQNLDKNGLNTEDLLNLEKNGLNTPKIGVDVDVDEVLADVVVEGVTAAVEQVSMEESGPNVYENNSMIVYPDPTSFQRKDEVEKRKLEVESGPNVYENNSMIVYPDTTSVQMKDEVEKPKLEVDGFSLVEKPTESTDWFDVSDQGADQSEGFSMGVGQMDEKVKYESLLQTLESMGFTNRSLNFSILQKRNFELEATVDDLLVAAGWDGVLEDLEEMGFTDKTTNIRVLMKNKGSLKQTVRDLVKLEKAVIQG